jgi:competence protein ComEA
MSARHVTCILVVPILLLAGCGPGGSTPEVVSHHDAQVVAGDAASGAAGVLVDVAGRVRRPGVYRLAAGSRVHQAIAAAGGARADADLGALNRAAAVVDGQQVLVPATGPPDMGSGGGGSRSGAGGSGARVSINSADVAALDELPGIGPVTAQHIVDEREQSGPYASIDDLDRVSGVGPATIESLRDVATT